MIIQLENVALRNFFSLSSAYVDFKRRGFVLVDGVNNNAIDNAKSNGSGKSSIFEGIFWILTGDTIRGTKDVVNKCGDGGACGELNFKVDSNEFKIIRYKDDAIYGNNLKVFCNGQDVSGKGIRDSGKVLAEYLPELNAQLLGAVIVLGQGLPQRFTNNTPAGRKDILEQLSKSDYMIEDIKSRLSLRRIDVNTDIRNVKDELIKLNSLNANLNNTIETTKNSIANMPPRSTYEDTIKSEQAVLDSCENDKATKEKEIDRLYSVISSIDEAIAADSQLYLNDYNNASSPVSQRVNEIKLDIASIDTQIRQLDKQIKDAKNIQTVCPYCNRPFDDVHEIDTSKWVAEREELVTNRLSKSSEIDEFNKKLDALSVEYKNKLATLDSKKLEKNTHSSSISALKEDVTKLTYAIKVGTSKVNDAEMRLREYDTKISLWQQSIQDAERAISVNNTQINADMKKEEELEQHLDVLNKLVNVASKDFRTYLLDGVIEFINERVKHYSQRLFGSSDAEFKNDGNQIWIGYAGKQYENLSGGEKQKIDIIVQFALRDMLMQILNFACNVLVLDEVFDNLDEIGCNNLIDLISEELRDIESLFIITHHSDIEIPYDDKITIIKNEQGVSSIA